MRSARVRRIALQVVLAVAGALLLARVFAGADWAGTCRVLSSAGPAVALALVPFGVALLLDTSAVIGVARAAELDVRAGAALGVRVVSEALHFGAPGGVVASEAAAVALFARIGLTTHEATAVVARRKQLVMRAHGAYLAIGAGLGAGALATIGKALGGRAPLPWLVLASAVVPVAMSIALGFAMRRQAAFARTKRVPHLTALSTFVFLAAWLVESAETAVILRLAGIPLPMASVLAVETAISLARSAVAFVPGGLGVQDLGYATALAALGVPRDHAAAFVLLKRGKELAWIALGFAVSALVASRRKRVAQKQPA